VNEERAVRELIAAMTASAKSPKGLAMELKRQLVAKFGLNHKYVYVWSPEEAKQRGWGDAWCLCAEEGPFEWAILMTNYNQKVYDHEHVFSEPYNHFILTFRKA
jgi:hypothetical protein